MKRYAIVRVDNRCPIDTEGFNSFTCEDLFRCGYLWQLGQDTNCKDFCRYGDTKEQMVRKVAQALERTIIDGIYVRFGKPITVEKLATDVVEFLGVE